jgi:hypothetical protein
MKHYKNIAKNIKIYRYTENPETLDSVSRMTITHENNDNCEQALLMN